MAQFLSTFLGVPRWKELSHALDKESEKELTPVVPLAGAFAALLLCATPVVIAVLDSGRERTSQLPTIAFGVCALLALMLRRRMGIPFVLKGRFQSGVRLTHTAVALGCIPAVIVLVLSPTLLADRHDTVSAAVGHGTGGAVAAPHLVIILGNLLLIAAWVSLTEELIFRGLLVSALRRLSLGGIFNGAGKRNRDLFVAGLSGALFGAAHLTTWGPLASIALTGLGFGFALAYIVNGEQLLPVILYHFVFDLLSILVSLYTR